MTQEDSMAEGAEPAGLSVQGESGTPTLRDRVRVAVRQVESEVILATLEKHRWNRRRTAQALGISYRSLMYKMKNCQIQGDIDRSGPAGA
jgi:two-component system response regulator AtoC